jgi:hypothetical protein
MLRPQDGRRLLRYFKTAAGDLPNLRFRRKGAALQFQALPPTAGFREP